MEFEYDAVKSAANKAKHGIDFIEAQELWRDEDALLVDARSDNEERFLVIGRIDEIIWSAVIALRSDKVRIISVRRSRTKEKDAYEKQDNIG